MTTRRFHANLTSSKFPHDFRELSSTVVQATPYENNRQVQGGFSGADAEQSLGICQTYFVNNVLPISRGYASLRFGVELTPPVLATNERIIDVFPCIGSEGRLFWCVQTNLRLSVYDTSTSAWVDQTFAMVAHEPAYVATLKGRTFFFVRDVGVIYEFNFTTGLWGTATVSGLLLDDVLGMCAAGANLILWEADRVYWSSNLDPLEFDPVLDVTAGSTAVLAVKGTITQCAPVADSFIIYTATNAVAAVATSNTLNPFRFAEVPNAAGCLRQRHVTINGGSSGHLVWTAGGMQLVTPKEASYVFPELSDGLLRKVVTRRSLASYLPELVEVTSIDVALTFISRRWLCVSIEQDDEPRFREAYIYDTQLNRWGRIELEHLSLLEFVEPSTFGSYTYDDLAVEFPLYSDLAVTAYAYFSEYVEPATPLPGHNFAAVLPDGRVASMTLWSPAHVDADARDSVGASEPCLFMGRFKVFRTQGAKLQNIRAIGVTDDQADVYAFGHAQNAEVITSRFDLVANPRQPGSFYGRLNADSFSVAVEGNFAITDLVLEATEAGMRNQRASAGAGGGACGGGGGGGGVVAWPTPTLSTLAGQNVYVTWAGKVPTSNAPIPASFAVYVNNQPQTLTGAQAGLHHIGQTPVFNLTIAPPYFQPGASIRVVYNGSGVYQSGDPLDTAPAFDVTQVLTTFT